MNTRPPSAAVAPAARLVESPFFASLSPAAIAAIAPLFEERVFDRDAVIVFEGEPPRWLYLVAEGHVKLIKHSEDGRDVILHIAMPGDLMGGVAAFGRRPHPFTARAMVPVRVLRIAGTDFAGIMDRHPQVARAVIDDLCERLVEAHEMMKSLAVDRVERRIARQLLKLAARAGRPAAGGVEIAIPLSRQDVADSAGTTVETAIRVLSRWRRAGWIDTVDGHLVVARAGALAAAAGDGRS